MALKTVLGVLNKTNMIDFHFFFVNDIVLGRKATRLETNYAKDLLDRFLIGPQFICVQQYDVNVILKIGLIMRTLVAGYKTHNQKFKWSVKEIFKI